MPQEKTVYVSIKVKVQVPDVLPEGIDDADEAIDQLVNEMDYSLTYDEDGLKIVDTEVMGHQDHEPVGL